MSSVTIERGLLLQISRDPRYTALVPELAELTVKTVKNKGCGCRKQQGPSDADVVRVKQLLVNRLSSDAAALQQLKKLLGANELRIKLYRAERNSVVIKKF